jgi:2-methylisocitrate lyase-like PEP mutase family enzyme
VPDIEDGSSRRDFLQRGLVAAGGLIPAASAATASAASQSRAAPPGTAGQQFKALLSGSGVLQCPVVHDMVGAKLSAQLGFPAIYAGGQTVSAGMFGAGDYGTLTMTELIEFAGRAVEATGMLVVGDADDGGGNPLNVIRTIRRYEHVGVACVMLEDMYGAKHVPGVPEGPMASIASMSDKLKAAVDARRKGLVILARTDALSAGEPFDRGLERLAAYAEAGADAVFMAGARVKQTRRIAEATKRPVMCVTGMPNEPDVALPVLQEAQVKIACYAYQLLALTAGVQRQALLDIKEHGRIRNFEERAISPEGYRALVDASAAAESFRRYNANRPPSQG